jgi:UDP-glucose 4-epimerase
MRTVVTGGAGFIGSHLVQRLLEAGHEVTVLDNLATGRRENVARLGHGLRLVTVDVADATAVRPHMEGADWVFHLAALADIVPSIERPLDYHRANVDGTISVLEAARAGGVRRFLYAASASCYGIASEYPTSENAPPRPLYPYALTKWIGEQYVLHWGQVYRLPVVSLRLFNVYGPRARTSGAYGAVFGVFLAQKLAGKPFTVVGEASRSATSSS